MQPGKANTFLEILFQTVFGFIHEAMKILIWFIIAIGIVIVILAVLLIVLIAQLIKHAPDFVNLAVRQPKWTMAILAVVIGITLFIVRHKYRIFYGALEVAFAMATAYNTAVALNSLKGPAGWIILGGSAYLVVRGLDNITTGMEDSMAPVALAGKRLPSASAPLQRRLGASVQQKV